MRRRPEEFTMALRVIPQAAAEHLADLAYLTTCLKADPQTAELAPNVEAASARLSDARVAESETGVPRHLTHATLRSYT
jgi:hypothetical protein